MLDFKDPSHDDASRRRGGRVETAETVECDGHEPLRRLRVADVARARNRLDCGTLRTQLLDRG